MAFFLFHSLPDFTSFKPALLVIVNLMFWCKHGQVRQDVCLCGCVCISVLMCLCVCVCVCVGGGLWLWVGVRTILMQKNVTSRDQSLLDAETPVSSLFSPLNLLVQCVESRAVFSAPQLNPMKPGPLWNSNVGGGASPWQQDLCWPDIRVVGIYPCIVYSSKILITKAFSKNSQG